MSFKDKVWEPGEWNEYRHREYQGEIAWRINGLAKWKQPVLFTFTLDGVVHEVQRAEMGEDGQVLLFTDK